MRYDDMLKQIKQTAEQKKELFFWLAFAGLTLPHFNPAYFNYQVPVMEKLINGWRAVSALVILIWLLGIKRRLSPVVLLIGIQQVYVLINTALQRGALRDTVVSVVSVMSVVMLYDLMQDDRKIFLSAQLFCFEVMIYANLVTVLLFPGGMYAVEVDELEMHYKNYFLGYYNGFTSVFVPALLIAYLYKNATGKKLRTYILTFAIFLTALRVWSGGVLLSMFGMAFAYILLKNRTGIFHYYSYWSVHIWFFVLIICLKLQNLFRWLVDDILGKWNSLTGRMAVWEINMNIISQSWIFGYGQKTTIDRKLETGTNWGLHAHNLPLELMYRGGLINLILFIAIVIIAGQTVYRYRDMEENKIISIAFLGWCIASVVEYFVQSFLIAMFVVAYYSNRQEQLKPNLKITLNISPKEKHPKISERIG